MYWWGRHVPQPSRPALRHAQPPVEQVPVLRRPGLAFDHLPQSSAKVKERIELYFYPPLSPHDPFCVEHFLSVTAPY
jgi:hypothetical protein